MVARFARLLAATVFCGVGILVVVGIMVQTTTWSDIALCVAYVTTIIAFQLFFFGRPMIHFSRRTVFLALVVQACLAYLPVLQFGKVWSPFLGFFAASALLVGKFTVSIPLCIAAVASGGLFAALGAADQPVPFAVVEGAVLTIVVGLMVYALSRLARLVAELREHGQVLAERMIAEERVRFSRDAHDILGLSLSAITLKSELTYKLVVDHPQRAKKELSEIVDMSRKALADVRAVAAGSRELSLPDECRAAGTVLRAAQVEVQLARSGGPLPESISTTLATVLREAVTNVLRHSKAQWCEITVRSTGEVVRMAVVNDGVFPDSAGVGPVRCGSGLRNLSYRVGRLGGRLDTHVGPDGTYRLCAIVPLVTKQGRRESAGTFPDQCGT